MRTVVIKYLHSFAAVALPILFGGSLSAGPVETLTVVATRSEMALDALPEAVSVVEAIQIRDDQASTMAEVLENLVGVDTAGGPRSSAQSVVVRGIGGSRVLYTIDGSRQSFDGGHRGRFVLDPSLIKRVDMLRGPASAQYGSGAIGGVLSVQTRNADDMLAADELFGIRYTSGYESAGNQWTNSVMGYASLVDFGVIAQRSQQENKDYRDGGNQRIDHTADQLDSTLLKLSYTPESNHRISGLFLESTQRNVSPSNAAKTVDDSNPLLNKENRSVNTSIAYRYQPDRGYLNGLDINAYKNRTGITEDRIDEIRHDTIDFNTLGANLTLRLQANERHRWLVGLDYHRDTSQASRNNAPRPQFPDARQQIQGLFFQYQADLGQRISLISALRYDQFKSHSNTHAAADIHESQSTARLGASFFATDWLTLHANYTEAFRAPNLLENYAAGIHFLGNEFQPNPELRPELAANQEVGVVFSGDNASADRRWRLRANLYRNDIENFIETLVTVEENTLNLACLGPNPPPGCVFGTISIDGTTTAVNLPKARISGWEVESSLEQGQLLAEVALGHSRGESLSDGRPLLNIPADALKLHLAWDSNQWRLGARANHYRRQDRVPPTDLNGGAVAPTAGYTLLDFYARYQPEQIFMQSLTVTVGIDNATDRRYRSHLATLNSAGRSFRLGFTYQL